MKVPYAYAHAWRVDSFCPLPFALCPLQTETEEAQDTTPKKRVEGGSQADRACALWSLLPRMVLHRQPGVRTLPKPVWRARFSKFEGGQA